MKSKIIIIIILIILFLGFMGYLTQNRESSQFKKKEKLIQKYYPSFKLCNDSFCNSVVPKSTTNAPYYYLYDVNTPFSSTYLPPTNLVLLQESLEKQNDGLSINLQYLLISQQLSLEMHNDIIAISPTDRIKMNLSIHPVKSLSDFPSNEENLCKVNLEIDPMTIAKACAINISLSISFDKDLNLSEETLDTFIQDIQLYLEEHYMSLEYINNINLYIHFLNHFDDIPEFINPLEFSKDYLSLNMKKDN